ncbi:MAG: hypothetical protein DRG78_00720 [Epsilonproteobacteria bacterium]|nr:MAG: hypothetical protein DRG78_00720 [Campylobacterota bacterium]
MSEDAKEENSQANKGRKCPLCDSKMQKVSVGETPKLKGIACENYDYRGNGCDYFLYANHKKLKQQKKKFTLEHLKNMHDGKEIRILNFTCKVDTKTPGTSEDGLTNFYINIKRDEDATEDI